MKRLIVATTLIIAFNVNAQISGAGIQVKVNSSSQLHKIPNDFKYGRTGTGSLITLGGDLFVDYSLNKKLKVRLKGGYEQKGFVNYGLQGSAEGTTIKTKLDQGNFHSISSDLVLNYYFSKMNIKPYALIGISTSYLLNRSYVINTANPFSHIFAVEDFNEKFKSYSDFNIGAVVGAGIDFKNIIWIEAEFNPDLISPVITNDLKIKNHTFSINIGINLLELFKK